MLKIPVPDFGNRSCAGFRPEVLCRSLVPDFGQKYSARSIVPDFGQKSCAGFRPEDFGARQEGKGREEGGRKEGEGRRRREEEGGRKE